MSPPPIDNVRTVYHTTDEPINRSPRSLSSSCARIQRADRPPHPSWHGTGKERDDQQLIHNFCGYLGGQCARLVSPFLPIFRYARYTKFGSAPRAAHRTTKTGIVEWVRTSWLSLPRSNPPRQLSLALRRVLRLSPRVRSRQLEQVCADTCQPPVLTLIAPSNSFSASPSPKPCE